MRTSADPRLAEYLAHLLEAMARIQAYTAGMDKATYLADARKRDAVLRNLEVIGEACNAVSRRYPDFAASHAAIPWTVAYDMRNALIHGYFKVDDEVVWRTIKEDLPGLQAAVTAARASLGGA